MVTAWNDQVAVCLGGVRGARNKARLTDRHVFTCVPHIGDSCPDVDVNNAPESHWPRDAAAKGVVVRFCGVAIITPGHLTRNVADDCRWLQFGGFSLGVDLESYKLANWGSPGCGILKLWMLGGEGSQGINVVEEGVDVDAAVLTVEVVANVAPVMVLQRSEPPRVFRLRIAAWEHTEVIGLRSQW